MSASIIALRARIQARGVALPQLPGDHGRHATGHAYVPRESVGEATVLGKHAGKGYADTAGRLFPMHFNDNHGAWDDDMIVGSIHSTTYIEMLYWLDRCGYQAWLSMDQYPYREEAAGAIGESILWLRQFDEVLRRHRTRLDGLIGANDPVKTSQFLRSAWIPASET